MNDPDTVDPASKYPMFQSWFDGGKKTDDVPYPQSLVGDGMSLVEVVKQLDAVTAKIEKH